MGLEAPLVGKRQHLVVHARGITYSQYGHPAVHQLLANPVHGHIRLCTHQHLGFPSQRLVDGLHQRRRLACARRSVYHRYVLRPQHTVHGLLLRLVQIGKLHRGKAERLSLLLRIKEVAQIPQPSFRPHHALQRVEHHPIRRLVERQLHAHLLLATLQVYQRRIVGNAHHHPFPVDIAHRTRKVEVLE